MSTLSALADHLWQTTICVLLAAGLAALVGRGRAALRHAIWTAASLKFVIPFGMFVAAGRALAAWLAPIQNPPALSPTLEILGQPFTVWTTADVPSQTEPAASVFIGGSLVLWALGAGAVLLGRWRQWRDVRARIHAAVVLTEGREMSALARVRARGGESVQVEIRQSDDVLEPGLAGWRRPVLLWPAALSVHLTDSEIDAVMAHEVAHLRRGDNVTAFVHAAVQALFWFHPAVWWLGVRLLDDRERACDDAALDCGANPEAYAGTLVAVCRFSLRHPASPFVAGIVNSRLRQRVEAIMTRQTPSALTSARRLILLTALLAAFFGPVAIGAVTARVPAGSRFGRGAAVADFMLAPAPRQSTPAPIAAPARLKPAGVAADQQKPRSGAPATADTASWLSANPNVTRTDPVVVSERKPEYPQAAKDANVQGVVTMTGIVQVDGTLTNITVVHSLDTVYGLDDAAVAAARQWLFKPATENGVAVPKQVTLEMAFRLGGDAFVSGAYPLATPGLIAPEVLKQVSARYSIEAMRNKVQGVVVVQVVIGENGAVLRARVLADHFDGFAGSPDLDNNAVQAAEQWLFKPAMLNGVPVASVMEITLTFRLH